MILKIPNSKTIVFHAQNLKHTVQTILMRGTSSERLGVAFNLEVQSRRHCILHSGLSEKRPPTSFAVYHVYHHFPWHLNLQFVVLDLIDVVKKLPLWSYRFFLLIVFQDFCIQANLERRLALSFRQNYSSLFGVNLHGLWAERCSRQNFGLILLSFCCALLLRQRTYSAVQNIWLAAWIPCQ